MGSLAEQILIVCPPSRLADVFCRRPLSWLAPLLRLAGDEGEAAGLAILGQHADQVALPATGRSHHLAAGRAAHENGGLRVGLRWRTTDYLTLFANFDGQLQIREFDRDSILSVEGRFNGWPAVCTDGTFDAATRRASEWAVRSLLAHVRGAFEALAMAQ